MHHEGGKEATREFADPRESFAWPEEDVAEAYWDMLINYLHKTEFQIPIFFQGVDFVHGCAIQVAYQHVVRRRKARFDHRVESTSSIRETGRRCL